ncbi:sugar ABC transporter permease [Paenibacillus sp.]|uniref:carbohydrate ABC transporter permease n=1 Tax=Paenibacillus sp. TaxID=58172 RepID=UPI002D386590|nr:sugar ABC transporter permease [Paenibacillus sp.]HZG58521.1 sugar ABC transporter permease [Paenibacillus sp.]
MNRQRRSEILHGYLFIAPNMLAMLIFVMIPIAVSFGLSFTNWDLINAPKFIGFSNFTDTMMKDAQFWVSLKNTAIFSLLSIPLGMLCALFFALLLNQALRGVTLYRALVFLPVVVSMISVSMVWRWVFNTDVGILNFVLDWFGVAPIGWITDERFALISVAMVAIWKSIGFNMVILLAGLKNVPSHLYEAATIDGAGSFGKLMRITLPLITPSVFFVAVMSVIGSFQVFDVVYMITGGGPGDATRVIYYWLWQNAFKFFQMGYASALAWVVFLILFAITLLQLKFFGKRVNYEMD